MSIESIDVGRKSLGYHQYTDTELTTAVGCPQTGAGNQVLFQAEAQQVRFRLDGKDPTDSVGQLLEAGECFKYTGKLSEVRFIRVAAGAILNIHVFA